MVKRVSLKGKGAAIFFGEDLIPPEAPGPELTVNLPASAPSPMGTTPPDAAGNVAAAKPPDTAPREPTPVVEAKALEESKQVLFQASKQDYLQTSNEESRQASKGIQESETLQGETAFALAAQVRAALQAQGLKANTFRYTQRELDALRDMVYELETKYGHKLDKNDLVRIGLNWLILDFQARKQASFLVRILPNQDRV